MQENDKILSELKKKKSYLEGELRKTINAINALTPENNVGKWKDKAINCIKSKKHFSQTLEILECVLDYETEIEDLSPELRYNYVKNLSLSLNKLCQEGHLKKLIVPGIKGHFYGLKSWFHNDGTPLSKYVKNELTELVTT